MTEFIIIKVGKLYKSKIAVRYWMVISWKQLKWELKYNWFKKESGTIRPFDFFFPFLVQLRILLFKNKYKTWWNQEICKVYREFKSEPFAFYRNYEGLPKWTDKI